MKMYNVACEETFGHFVQHKKFKSYEKAKQFAESRKENSMFRNIFISHDGIIETIKKEDKK
jgi:hypothetical protein